MSDTDGAMRRQFDMAQRELRRPLPLALAIIAIVGWLVVVGLAWALASQRSEHREQISRVERTQGNLEQMRGRVTAAKADLDKLEKTRAEAQSALEAGQKEQAAIKTNVDELTRNRDTLTKEISRVEQSLAGLTQQAAARTKELTEAQQGLQGARERSAEMQKQVADQRAELDKVAQQRTAAEQQLQVARQELEKLRGEIGQGTAKPPAQ